jgi:hypothetical protein
MDFLNEDGLLVLTFHGRRLLVGHDVDGALYLLSQEKFESARKDFLSTGYGYVDYDNMTGLGFSLTKPNWFFDEALDETEWTVRAVLERAWDDFHDVCAISRTPVYPGSRGVAQPRLS